MTGYKVIYEPRGKAAEYGELAVNLYNGCSHGCVYCYAPNVVKKSREEFFGNPQPRIKIMDSLASDVNKMILTRDKREVFMCFTCDPFQPLEDQYTLAYQAILMFELGSIPYRILTKGGWFAVETADQWSRELCTFGTSLIYCNDNESEKYEPGAAATSERIQSLHHMKLLGFKTWVSLEPVWTPEDAFALIERTHPFVDEYRIGKLNYHPQSKNVNWKQFAIDVSKLCDELGCKYILKESLRKQIEAMP